MHEYSIVQALIEQCEAEVKKHKATEISKVVIKVGQLSGVEPHLLEVAFETFKEISPVCQKATLEMQLQSVEIRCRACHQTSLLNDHCYLCPHCKSSELSITDGEDLVLMQLEMT